jgi:hypothetical protein
MKEKYKHKLNFPVGQLFTLLRNVWEHFKVHWGLPGDIHDIPLSH